MGKHLNPLEKEFLIRQYKSMMRAGWKALSELIGSSKKFCPKGLTEQRKHTSERYSNCG